jgi:hypothetical protein
MGRRGQRQRVGRLRSSWSLVRVFTAARRSNRAVDPLRALEQRRDGLRRLARVHRAAARAAGQGRSAGFRPLSEPKWLGLIQHDMLLFDHGMPRADGTVNPNSARRPTSTLSSSARPRSRSSHTRWRGPSRRPTRSMRRTIP